MREDKSNTIEVHVAGITFAGDDVLILRRSSERKFFPNLWECGGGQVNPGENLEEAVKRQLKEETGIDVKVLEVVGTYEIDAPFLKQKKIPGVYFVCEFLDYFDKQYIKLSDEHTASLWRSIVHLDLLNEYKFIPGLKKEIKKAYKIYKKSIGRSEYSN